MRLNIGMIGGLLLPLAFGRAHAESASTPRAQLQELVDRLQSAPIDRSLRERIIKLALTVSPRPKKPAEALRFEGRAEHAFKGAKAEADYLAAAEEYGKALLAAPWAADDYFNQGTAYEKAGKPLDAKRSFELYLLAAPDARDAEEVTKKIAGLEYDAEKFARGASAGAIAAARQREAAAWLKNLDGARFRLDLDDGYSILQVQGTQIIVFHRAAYTGNEEISSNIAGAPRFEIIGRQLVVPRISWVDESTRRDEIATISDDGSSISLSFDQVPAGGGGRVTQIWRRVALGQLP